MCWQLATVATSATLPRYARRRGLTPLATACAAHFVRGICRYCPLPTTNYHLHFYTSTRPFFVATGGTRSCASVAPTPLSVERELDPPASANGRRGLRPSRDTWRWRPRHRILPASCRDGEGAVATITTACAAHFVRGDMSLLPTANYQLSTILYQLHFYTSTRPFRRRGRRRYYTAIFHDGEAPSLREGRAPARPRFLRCVVLCAAPAGQSLAIRPRAGVFGGRSRPPRRGSWRRAWRRWR